MSNWDPEANDVFLRAVEIPAPEDRLRFLQEACAGNSALRAKVDNLLLADQAAGSFLEHPAADPLRTAAHVHSDSEESLTPTTRTGTAVGPYKLVQEIGAGGMGTVYLAQQTEPVRRLVALKLINPGMDSRQVLARFEAERQALALMDHPNIAKVLDAGATPDGRPYFVMELVKGTPITKYCDEHRLTLRQRLELFIPVCQAIQHAHQKGIIHRDVKPSNVLVAPYDGKPVVKVIDFGIAKATGQPLTERTLVTGLGAVIGTPEYMSPEQAELNNLDVDTRADVYSLGVLLYELLTGTTPLTRKRVRDMGLLEVLRTIREEEPPRPSTRLSTTDELPSIAANRGLEPRKLSGLIRGELDWIVMRALEKDRNRRYDSANGLAADVGRYLADEPVLACPASAWYRLKKHVRRNKKAFTITGLILFFIVLIGGGAGWVIRDRAARQDRAATDLDTALDRSEFFQAQGKRAESLAAFERVELLAGQVPPEPARDERRAAFKDRLAADAKDQVFIARFEDIRQRRRLLKVEEGITIPAYADLWDALDQYGISLGATAASAATQIQGRPEPVRQQIVAALGELWSSMSAEQKGERQWLFAVLEAVDNDPWRMRLRKAAAEGDRQNVGQLAREVDVRTQPPSFLLLTARSLPAQQPIRLRLYQRIQHAYPADFSANEDLAFELVELRRYAEAVRFFTAAMALRPDDPVLDLNRGSALHASGEVGASIADFRRSIALEPKLAMTHAVLGGALADMGLLDEALAECQEAIRLNPKLAQAWSNRGRIYSELKQHEKSLADYSEAIKMDPKNARSWANRSGAHLFLKQNKKALDDSTEAVRLDPLDPLAHYNHGYSLQNLNRLDDAMAAYGKAIQLQEDYTDAHDNLAVALANSGRFAEALVHFRRSLELGAKIPGWHTEATARMTKLCEHHVELERKLSFLIEEKSTPAKPKERIELAGLCITKRLYRTSAVFYEEAFAGSRPLADDIRTGNRYTAACVAAMAGRGEGKDADKLDEKERAALRSQALNWLQSDLAAWKKELASSTPEVRAFARMVMLQWQTDTDLAGVRGADALSKLPEAERPQWQKLWDEVADTVAQAQEKPTPEKKSDPK